MAGLRSLKKNYLREAAADGRSTVEQQLAWLEGKRKTLFAEVDDGDWEISQQSRANRSTIAARKKTAQERLDAVVAAIEELESTNGEDSSSTGALLSFRIHGIQP